MNCAHCGKENPSESKFCAHCGEKLASPSAEPTTETGTTVQAADNENLDTSPKKKSKPWLFALAVCAIALIPVVLFSWSHIKEKQLNDVDLNSFSVTREQYDVIDPTYIMRYALNGDATSSYLKEQGFSYVDYKSGDGVTWYRKTNSLSYDINEINIAFFSTGHTLRTLDCTYESQYTEQILPDLAQTMEDITGTSLRWHHQNGSFVDTNSLAPGTKYICILDCEPHFAKLELDEEGSLKISYAFCEDEYFQTYDDYIANAVPADYAAIQENQCDGQKVYFTGEATSVMHTDYLDFFCVTSADKNGYGVVYQVFFTESEFVGSVQSGDKVKVYGTVLSDMEKEINDMFFLSFPWEGIQADVVEIIDEAEE